MTASIIHTDDSTNLKTKDQDEEPPCFLDMVSDEILINILSKLSPHELYDVVPYVCKRWHNLLSEQILWKDSELVYERHMKDEYSERFVKVLNRVPRLARLDISAAPYTLDLAKDPLPIADILSAGAQLQRDFKMSCFSVSYCIPSIPTILELNKNTLTSLSIEDIYCQQLDHMDFDEEVQCRTAHEELIKAVLISIKSLPALKKLTYDFTEAWKYLNDPTDPSREESVNLVMDCIRSMPKLQSVALLNLKWNPDHPIHNNPVPTVLESLCLFEAYGSDEALAALILQNRATLKYVVTPDKMGEHLTNALRKCPHLVCVDVPTIKVALSLDTSAPKLKTLHINSYYEEDVTLQLQASEILKSSLFSRLHHLYMYGEWEDPVRAAIVQKSTNLKSIQLREFINPIKYLFDSSPHMQRLGNDGSAVVIQEMLNGSMPKLTTFDVGLNVNWSGSDSESVQEDWRVPLQKLKLARPHLHII